MFVNKAGGPPGLTYYTRDAVADFYLDKWKDIMINTRDINYACEQIADLFIDYNKVYEKGVEAASRRYNNASDIPSIKAITQFERNDSRYIFNIYNIVNMLTPESNIDWSLKLSNVTPEDIVELDFSQTRLKAHNRDLMFWEDKNGDLCAISIGPKLVFIIVDKDPSINIIYDFVNPGNKINDYINAEQLSGIFNEYKTNGFNYKVERDIKYVISSILSNPTKYYNTIKYKNANDILIFGQKDIKKAINTTTTKIFTDPSYSP